MHSLVLLRMPLRLDPRLVLVPTRAAAVVAVAVPCDPASPGHASASLFVVAPTAADLALLLDALRTELGGVVGCLHPHVGPLAPGVIAAAAAAGCARVAALGREVPDDVAAASKWPRTLVVVRRTPGSLVSALRRRLAAAAAGYDELVVGAGGAAATAAAAGPTWQECGGGALALWHRPRVGDLARFAADGASHIVSLLGPGERPEELGAAAAAAGLNWTWVSLAGAGRDKLRAPDAGAALRGAWLATARALAAGGRVLVHCAAGIHRTGVFAYGLLRLAGELDPADAAAALRPLRRVTAEGVLEWRLQIAEALVGPLCAPSGGGGDGGARAVHL
jgi:predicted protein tyrosine phosphatase